MVDSGHFDGFRVPLSSAPFYIRLVVKHFSKATEDRSSADTDISPDTAILPGPTGKCTNYIDLEIPYLFINFIAHINHVHLMKRFTPYLTVLLPAIISLCLSSCNVTYRTSMPSMPWKMATDSIKPDIPPKFNGGDPKVEFRNGCIRTSISLKKHVRQMPQALLWWSSPSTRTEPYPT